MTASFACVSGLAGLADVIPERRLVRPPGANPEGRFLQSCIRCGACTEVCPVHGVGIANLTDGLRNVGTPKLAVPDGYCMIFKDLETPSAQTGAEWKSTRENEKEELCSECINACPTGALEPITLGNLRLGIAVVNKDVCWAFRYNHCTFPCVEACVFDAIKVTVGPVVDAEKCVGCNQCSFVCVTRLQPGPSSITVEPVPT